MDYHDELKQIGELFGNREFVQQLSPKFSELSSDLDLLLKKGNDPVTIAVLLFKLVEERQKTNQILEKLFDKLDLALKNMEKSASLTPHSPQLGETFIEILPEQDQIIMHLVQEKGQVSAEEIRKELGYKRQNAASQRLNQLYRSGHLNKIQSGRKVLFAAKQN